jgi:hypothetical protein
MCCASRTRTRRQSPPNRFCRSLAVARCAARQVGGNPKVLPTEGSPHAHPTIAAGRQDGMGDTASTTCGTSAIVLTSDAAQRGSRCVYWECEEGWQRRGKRKMTARGSPSLNHCAKYGAAGPGGPKGAMQRQLQAGRANPATMPLMHSLRCSDDHGTRLSDIVRQVEY